MTTTPAMPELPDGATALPDGSAFAIASFPLPSDHWLYAPREYRDGEEETIELPSPILSHQAHGDVVRAAIRYAVRSATMCGKEPDFDPDALVQNAMYALCGPFGGATLQAQPAEVSDAELRETIDALRDPGTVSTFYNGYYTLTPDELRRAILTQRPQAESEARRAAQEQLYTERERHTAEVKRLQAEIGRLQAERPQAVPMTDEWFDGAMRLADAYADACFDQGLNQRTEDPNPEAKREKLVEHLRGITAPAGGEKQA